MDEYDRLSDEAAEEASLNGNGVRALDVLQRKLEEEKFTREHRQRYEALLRRAQEESEYEST